MNFELGGKKVEDKRSPEEKVIDSLYDQISMITRISEDNNKFYMIALNLSGRRDELEEASMKLVEEHGYLQAMRMSHGDK